MNQNLMAEFEDTLYKSLTVGCAVMLPFRVFKLKDMSSFITSAMSKNTRREFTPEHKEKSSRLFVLFFNFDG